MNWLNSNRTYHRRDFLRRSALLFPLFLSPQLFAHSMFGRRLDSLSGVHHIRRTTFAMGTLVSIEACGKDEVLLHNAVTQAFDELHRCDRLLSVYDPQSDISRINANAGKHEVTVDDTTIEIIDTAKEFSARTDGSFDCTIEPLMRLWGFRNDIRWEPCFASVPSDNEIALALDAVGYQNILVDGTTRSIGLLNDRSAIDLGGIAVGFTVDRMAAILKNAGIDSALINHSGDIYAIGTPPESDGWSIAVPSPTKPEKFLTTLALHDQAISTSGNYEKFVSIDKQKFGHILDRATGKPSTNNLSVSVIAQSSLEADVYSTAFFTQAHADIQKNAERLNVNVVVV